MLAPGIAGEMIAGYMTSPPESTGQVVFDIECLRMKTEADKKRLIELKTHPDRFVIEKQESKITDDGDLIVWVLFYKKVEQGV